NPGCRVGRYRIPATSWQYKPDHSWVIWRSQPKTLILQGFALDRPTSKAQNFDYFIPLSSELPGNTDMTPQTALPGVARFGPYEVDVRSGELRKFGTRIKLGEQPLRILTLLIDRAGDMVSREELRSQLWSANTFVDFDHGLNSA